MVSLMAASSTFGASCFGAPWISNVCVAAESVPAAKIFPDTTQAMVSFPNVPEFIALWNKTEMGKLANDPKLTSFWKTQREEIQSKFSEAGWQLNLKVEDLEELAAGQTSFGWIARDGAKPYSIAMTVEIGDRKEKAEQFLSRLDKQLTERKATSKVWTTEGISVTQYTAPSLANETKMLESHYAISNGTLLATDDAATMTEMIRAQSGDRKDSLAGLELYKDVQSKVANAEEKYEVEYFVRPLGIAKLMRAIGGRAPKNPDLLKILETQGFDAIQCVAGNVQLAEDGFDVFHHGFAKIAKPTKPAVGILDFPNVEKLSPPAWLSKESASVVALSWNLKDAFAKFEPLVDAYVGSGTFQGVMEGIRDDVQGPQIDIQKEVLPYLSSELFIVTEIQKPVTPESKRSLVLFKLKDPDKKLNKVIERYGKNEPNATPLDFEGYRIWNFKNEEETEVTLEFDTSKKSSKKEEQEEEMNDKPLLEQWAITIMDGYFVFGSDAELIKEAILRFKSGESLLMKEPDVERVVTTLGTVAGSDKLSVMQFNRADRSFEMQYDLFREGKLNASKSVLAAILDRILDPKNKNQTQAQKLNGDQLPPFEEIRSYFQPSGGIMHTEEDGWSMQSFVLDKD
jgi:hypothetical protein